MFDLGKIECTTALEVELLAALVQERRLRSRLARPLKLEPKRKPLTFLQPPSDPYTPAARDPEFGFPAGDASIKEIQAAVARQFQVTINDLLSQRRDAWTVMARHAAIILCHTLTPHSYPTMARQFANRDHTTMMSAIKKNRDVQLELECDLGKNRPLAVWAHTVFAKMTGKRAHRRLVPDHESVA